MNRRGFAKGLVCLPLAAGAGQGSLRAIAQAALEPGAAASGASSSGSTPSGPLELRLQQTLNRVLSGDGPAYTEELLLADVRPTAERRFTEYSGDLSGRYVGALAVVSEGNPGRFPALKALVERIVALQKSDGYFGAAFHYDKPTDDDLALLWGNGRLLVGLLEYYKLNPAPEVQVAAVRLGDFLVRIGPLMLSKETRDAFGSNHFATSYICWMQQTEGLALLYKATRDERYRKLADQIAAVTERRAGDHVHGYLCALRGIVYLYRETSDPVLLRQSETAWQQVAESQDLLLTGGVPEGWSPNRHRTEGCAEADWVRLSLALWKTTGNSKYLAAAERAIFNEFAFNQFLSGDFGHRVYTETGFVAAGAVRGWWCCTLHGLRCFPDIQSSSFRSQDGAVWFDLPVDGRLQTDTLAASVESSLGHNGALQIRITSAGKASTALRIRKPAWATTVEIRLNGRAGEFPAQDGYRTIERSWAAGDTVEVKYGMELRTEPAGNNRVAYSFGPWLLGASASSNPDYFNELTVDNRLMVEKRDWVAAAGKHAAQGQIPIAGVSFAYRPAEYPDQPGTVMLRPIAEQAFEPPTSWELRFLREDA
jgi:DUF1680 family protein